MGLNVWSWRVAQKVRKSTLHCIFCDDTMWMRVWHLLNVLQFIRLPIRTRNKFRWKWKRLLPVCVTREWRVRFYFYYYSKTAWKKELHELRRLHVNSYFAVAKAWASIRPHIVIVNSWWYPQSHGLLRHSETNEYIFDQSRNWIQIFIDISTFSNSSSEFSLHSHS